MVDCRECKYYRLSLIRDWGETTVKEVIYCMAHDNPLLLKTYYSECKVWTSKEVEE